MALVSNRRVRRGAWDTALLGMLMVANTILARAARNLAVHTLTLLDLLSQIGLLVLIVGMMLLTLAVLGLGLALLWVFWLPTRLLNTLSRHIGRTF